MPPDIESLTITTNHEDEGRGGVVRLNFSAPITSKLGTSDSVTFRSRVDVRRYEPFLASDALQALFNRGRISRVVVRQSLMEIYVSPNELVAQVVDSFRHVRRYNSRTKSNQIGKRVYVTLELWR